MDPAEVPPDVGDDPGAVDDGDEGRRLLGVCQGEAPAGLHHRLELLPELLGQPGHLSWSWHNVGNTWTL